MAANDATLFPVYGQAFRFKDVIKLNTTGNPLTGGLTTPAVSISKDGAAFAAAAGTITEIGTTGWFYVDLTAVDMTAKVIAYTITAANANAVYATGEIKTLDLAQYAGKATDESILKLERMLRDIHDFDYMKMDVVRSEVSSAMTLYQTNGSTTKVTGTATDDGVTAVRGELS